MIRIYSAPKAMTLRDPMPGEVDLGKIATPKGSVLKVQVLSKDEWRACKIKDLFLTVFTFGLSRLFSGAKTLHLEAKTGNRYIFIHLNEPVGHAEIGKTAQISKKLQTPKNAKAPTLEAVTFNSKDVVEELKIQGIFFQHNEHKLDPIEIEKELLFALPPGHYYTVHCTTDRLAEQIYKDKLAAFAEEHPDGVILALNHKKDPKSFKRYLSPLNSMPVCTFCFPPSIESHHWNLHNIEQLKK